MERTSRRRFLEAAAATGALAAVNVSVLAQDGAQDEEVILLGGLTAGWLSYRVPGTSGDATNQNPTLTLQAGTTYTLVWENVDGEPHNIAIQDQQGENLEVLEPLGIDQETYQQLNETGANESVSLEISDGNVTGVSTGNETGGNQTGGQQNGGQVAQTEIISEEGAVQAVRFTASEEMAQYICLVHPNTMLGDVQVESGGGGGNGNNTSG